jgi:hypothetical protein
MTEAQLYEKLGRQQAAHDALKMEYARLLLLFAQVLRGETDPAAVTLDLAAQTWTLTPPATTNGETPE